MGADTLPTRADGATIYAEWANVIKRAISGDFLPRNSSGIVTDIAGNIGDSTRRWIAAYARSIYFGLAANDCSFSVDGSGDIIVKRAGVQVGKFVSGGIDGDTIKSETIPRLKFIPRNVVLDGSDPGLGGVSISASSGLFTTSSTSYVDATNLSISLTTSGSPIFYSLIPDGSNVAYLTTQAYSDQCYVASVLDGAIKHESAHNGTAANSINKPVGCIQGIIPASAGAHVLKIQAKATSPRSSAIWYAKLVAYEI